MTYSVKNFYERIGAGANDFMLRSDQPMDAGNTWTILDNIAHMVDEAPKYRINWIKSSTDSSLKPGPMVHYFPSLIVDQYRYPRYDLRVAAGGGNSIVEIRASIVTVQKQGPINGLDSGVIGTATGSAPAITVEWIIDTDVNSGDVNRAPMEFIPAPSVTGSGNVVGNHTFLKLLIEYDYQVSESGPNASIWAVQLREFPP